MLRAATFATGYIYLSTSIYKLRTSWLLWTMEDDGYDGDWRWTPVLAEVLKYLHSYLKDNMLKWYYLSIMV